MARILVLEKNRYRINSAEMWNEIKNFVNFEENERTN